MSLFNALQLSGPPLGTRQSPPPQQQLEQVIQTAKTQYSDRVLGILGVSVGILSESMLHSSSDRVKASGKSLVSMSVINALIPDRASTTTRTCCTLAAASLPWIQRAVEKKSPLANEHKEKDSKGSACSRRSKTEQQDALSDETRSEYDRVDTPRAGTPESPSFLASIQTWMRATRA